MIQIISSSDFNPDYMWIMWIEATYNPHFITRVHLSGDINNKNFYTNRHTINHFKGLEIKTTKLNRAVKKGMVKKS